MATSDVDCNTSLGNFNEFLILRKKKMDWYHYKLIIPVYYQNSPFNL